MSFAPDAWEEVVLGFERAIDEATLDAASARRVIAALRREQAARDGRRLGRTWRRIADRIERDYPGPRDA